MKYLILLYVWSSPLVFDRHKLLALVKLVLGIYDPPCQVLGFPISHCCWWCIDHSWLTLCSWYDLIPSRFSFSFSIEHSWEWLWGLVGWAKSLRFLLLVELIDLLLSIVEVLVMEIKGASWSMRLPRIAPLLWLVAISVVGRGLPAWLIAGLGCRLGYTHQSSPWLLRHNFLHYAHLRRTIVLRCILFVPRLLYHLSKFDQWIK